MSILFSNGLEGSVPIHFMMYSAGDYT